MLFKNVTQNYDVSMYIDNSKYDYKHLKYFSNLDSKLFYLFMTMSYCCISLKILYKIFKLLT